jgi:hypothetical protein
MNPTHPHDRWLKVLFPSSQTATMQILTGNYSCKKQTNRQTKRSDKRTDRQASRHQTDSHRYTDDCETDKDKNNRI